MIARALVTRLMQAQGWTHQALAEATGIDAGNLYRILSGQQEPRVGTAIRIAQCLKVRVEELFLSADERRRHLRICGQKLVDFALAREVVWLRVV